MPLTPGSSLGGYEIIGTLGIGGMGEVYRALDPRLRRQVAVKVLPQAMAGDPERLRRFEREAQTIASLSHPNIVTIHSVEEAEGTRFITMELVDGRTLSEIIPPGGLPVSRFFELALPIVSAVSAAHDRSVAHRDLKPENVMVGADGRVRVLDFGLATSATAPNGATGASPHDDVTRARSGVGQMLGTVPYMAPEQIKGLGSDVRSDVFSLGVMLFEMATGERPFAGETSADVMSAILRDPPPSVTEIKADLPRDLAALLRRCLEKAPADRFASAREVAPVLEKLKRDVDAGGARTSRASIAVLAFVNMSADPEQEFFCDGMAEDIINELTRVEGLHVVARTSSFQFRERGRDLREVGEKLGVSAVLEGSVRKSGNRVRISARLVNVANGYDLWSERYDRELDDIFALQDEISAAIVGTLKAKLVAGHDPEAGSRPLRTRRHQPSPEAYELLLKARFLHTSQVSESIAAAKSTVEQAIALDPEFAPAQALLASCYITSYAYGLIGSEELEKRAVPTSRRALELDDGLPEAHRVKASIDAYLRWDFTGAEAGFRRAIELEPGSALGYRGLGMIALAPQGRLDESLDALRTAYRLDPLQPVSSRNLAEVLYWSGRYREALRQFEHTLTMNSSSPFVLGEMAAIWSYLGEPGKALELRQADLRRVGRNEDAETIGRVFAEGGEPAVYRWYLNALVERARTRRVSPLSHALLHGVLGDVDDAFYWLNRALDERWGLAIFFKSLPWLTSLRDDPRWSQALPRMNVA